MKTKVKYAYYNDAILIKKGGFLRDDVYKDNWLKVEILATTPKKTREESECDSGGGVRRYLEEYLLYLVQLPDKSKITVDQEYLYFI